VEGDVVAPAREAAGSPRDQAGEAPPDQAQQAEEPAERIVIRDRRRVSVDGAPTAEPEADTQPVASDAQPSADDAAADESQADATTEALKAEVEALREALEERTRDLQRLSAEYANYRKRVERDRALVTEQATGQVLSELLPVLDDLDRAREHGDLVGAFGAVAEHLLATTAKFGLTAFGEKGDPFDPTRHEAVAHQTSSEVTESTCVEVMRRGYLLGDKLLRPALVAVADPE